MATLEGIENVAKAPCRCTEEDSEYICLRHGLTETHEILVNHVGVCQQPEGVCQQITALPEPTLPSLPDPAQSFPVTRRVNRRVIDTSKLDTELREWASDRGIKIGTVVLKEDYLNVLQTL